MYVERDIIYLSVRIEKFDRYIFCSCEDNVVALNYDNSKIYLFGLMQPSSQCHMQAASQILD